MINDTEEINVVIQDTDSVTVTEGTPTDIAEIMHNEEIRQENEAQRILNENDRIANENQRILNEQDREDYINDLKQRVLDGEFNGQDGEDGFSPIANVSKSGDTATITITDKNGTTTASISDGSDGRDGVDGQDGTDGEDGFSPVVSMEKQGKVTTLTITDATGVHTTEIKDGNDGSGTGDMLKTTYDTNDNGVVDNAEKVNNHTVESDVPSGLDTILSSKQNIMQYSTMPTASATYEDKIVQYIGTTGTYTNGYFYICTEDSGTYSWTNINVQNPGLPSDLARIYTCDTFTGSTSGDLFDACKQVYEDYTNGINSALYVHVSTDTANTTNGFYIYYYDSTYGFHKLIRTENKTIINQTSSYSQITESSGVIDLTITNGEVVRINPGISTGQAARHVLEVGRDYSTPYTPQYNGSPATKKYVDDELIKKMDVAPTRLSDSGQGGYNNPFVLDEMTPGYYFIETTTPGTATRYFRLTGASSFSITSSNAGEGYGIYLYIPSQIDVSSLVNGDIVFYYEKFNAGASSTTRELTCYVYNSTESTKVEVDDSKSYVRYYGTTITSSAQTFNGVKTFSSVPVCNTAPTNDGDLANKKYVDDNIPDELADLSDDSTHRVVTDTEKSTWSGKQDALVSGTNIKTINNTSILGSGNIEVGADIPQQETAPSNPSENDLWIDTDENTNIITVDNSVSTTSTNPISNQAITNYVNNQVYERIATNSGFITLNAGFSFGETNIYKYKNHYTGTVTIIKNSKFTGNQETIGTFTGTLNNSINTFGVSGTTAGDRWSIPTNFAYVYIDAGHNIYVRGKTTDEYIKFNINMILS